MFLTSNLIISCLMELKSQSARQVVTGTRVPRLAWNTFKQSLRCACGEANKRIGMPSHNPDFQTHFSHNVKLVLVEIKQNSNYCISHTDSLFNEHEVSEVFGTRVKGKGTFREQTTAHDSYKHLCCTNCSPEDSKSSHLVGPRQTVCKKRCPCLAFDQGWMSDCYRCIFSQ